MASQNKQFYILSAQLHSSFTTMCVLILFFFDFWCSIKVQQVVRNTFAHRQCTMRIYDF